MTNLPLVEFVASIGLSPGRRDLRILRSWPFRCCAAGVKPSCLGELIGLSGLVYIGSKQHSQVFFKNHPDKLTLYLFGFDLKVRWCPAWTAPPAHRSLIWAGERLAVCHSYEWCCGLDLKVPVHVGWVAQVLSVSQNFRQLPTGVSRRGFGFLVYLWMCWSRWCPNRPDQSEGHRDVSLPDLGSEKKKRLRIGSDVLCFFLARWLLYINLTILMNILLLWLLFPVPLLWDMPRNNPGRVTASRVGLQFTTWDFGGGFWGETNPIWNDGSQLSFPLQKSINNFF